MGQSSKSHDIKGTPTPQGTEMLYPPDLQVHAGWPSSELVRSTALLYDMQLLVPFWVRVAELHPMNLIFTSSWRTGYAIGFKLPFISLSFRRLSFPKIFSFCVHSIPAKCSSLVLSCSCLHWQQSLLKLLSLLRPPFLPPYSLLNLPWYHKPLLQQA